ncbi:MAG: hypothetical protein GY725_14580 [bacterium]|nr:hypothetical protein [bacterium]
MLQKRFVFQLMLGAFLALCAQPAMAVTTGAPTLPAGYGSDDGTHLWSPTGTSVISLELFDEASFAPGSEFGFFFGSSPSTLIPVFSSATPSEQAEIVLYRGMVQNAAATVPSSFFDPTPYHLGDPIGFYLRIDTSSGPLVLHSVPGLNAGLVDAVATHASGDGESYVLVFEHEGTTVAMNLVTGVVSHTVGEVGGGESGGGGPRPQDDYDCNELGICGGGGSSNPVPEPEALLAFLIGLAIVVTGIDSTRVRALLVTKQD